MPEIQEQKMLECTTRGSNKYYEVTLTRLSRNYRVTGRYGKRAGTWRTRGGTSTEKGEYANLRQAKRAFDDLVRSKLAKGYVETENAPKPEKKAPKEKTMEEASLERFSLMASDL